MLSNSLRLGLFTGACFAGAGVAQAFLPLWLNSRGVTAAEIGAILGMTALVRLVTVPGWGLLADLAPRRRPMLAAAAFGAGLLAATYPLGHSVLTLGVLVALQGMTAAGLSPLTDALTMGLAIEGRLSYGRVRAWGSASYMLATAATGPLLTWAGLTLVPLLVAASYILAAAFASLLPEPVRAVQVAGRGSPTLLRLPGFRTAVIASALIQGSHAAYYGFAPLLWRAAGLGDTAIGLLIAEGIVMEIVLFVWGGAWVARLGPARLTAFAASACLLRWSVTALTASLPVLMLVQILHAGTFAMQHLSSMTVLTRVVPPRRTAGAQALHSALGVAAPTGLLIWLSGLVYARVGGGVFFLMAALGGSALLLVRPLALAMRQPAGDGILVTQEP